MNHTKTASNTATFPRIQPNYRIFNLPKVSLRNLIYLVEWIDVMSICVSSPNEAKVADRVGDLPLHEACLHGAPFKVVQSLVTAYPLGIRKKGFCGRLP